MVRQTTHMIALFVVVNSILVGRRGQSRGKTKQNLVCGRPLLVQCRRDSTRSIKI